ncbi:MULTISPECIES: hypothetical protein [Tenebrionibacter/Tenebrionicola group]|uniref:Uncharacterized protein n=2 Tax=Tenebrionibacter/Tenebrionicola group TaxID=2969848 RepID=A0A8K0XWX8_9ENTR|nr:MULTISPECIES: hypothetical protein [Tenebrionibacter/Tenebrionicola group]MBK4715711.1 hypothetical protein [Tenebrionibacter intestinalis]MBV4413929.1 hypothetical protein [Tenebrionicola larvae]MBV5096291.1 hypothetical protein [Tenebrionicola larvae]
MNNNVTTKLAVVVALVLVLFIGIIFIIVGYFTAQNSTIVAGELLIMVGTIASIVECSKENALLAVNKRKTSGNYLRRRAKKTGKTTKV